MYSVKRSCGAFDITKMIECNDIYNSSYIYLLDSLPNVGSFSTPYYVGRIDIINRCIYPSAPPMYSGVLSVYNRLYLDNCTCMVSINYPDQTCIYKMSMS